MVDQGGLAYLGGTDCNPNGKTAPLGIKPHSLTRRYSLFTDHTGPKSV